MSQKLKYLFAIRYQEGFDFVQNADDISTLDPQRSAFYDALHSRDGQPVAESRLNEITKCQLTDGQITVAVDLLTGEFTCSDDVVSDPWPESGLWPESLLLLHIEPFGYHPCQTTLPGGKILKFKVEKSGDIPIGIPLERRLIYHRRRCQHAKATISGGVIEKIEPIGEEVHFCLGWQATINGQNVKRVIEFE